MKTFTTTIELTIEDLQAIQGGNILDDPNAWPKQLLGPLPTKPERPKFDPTEVIGTIVTGQ